ncbi:FUSC family protein [Gordonia sp. DT219]|uniref:FUSC family protein n=1 Tax=Gordonia sp. DT219 TaxID=3416658 RepID=UPI003CF6A055
MTTDAPAQPILAWHWVPAVAALIAAVPAVVVTAVVDVGAGAALAIGLIPALIAGIPRSRRARLIIPGTALIVGLPIIIGSAVSPFPVVAVAVMAVLPLLAVWSALAWAGPRVSAVLIGIAPPLTGVGLSSAGIESGLRITGLFLLGAAAAFTVAIVIPGRLLPADAAGRLGGRSPGLNYGLRVGAVGALTAGIGYAFDFDHVGWACAAALLVMRPDPDMQLWRTAGRFVSVVTGGALAVILVQYAPAWVVAVMVGIALATAAGTRGSRWYVLPTFTTFLVILMLGATTAGTAPGRLGERVGETVLGLVVAAVIGLGVPAVVALRSRQIRVE